MSEEKELEQFKQEFIQGYVDTYLDRLLDLRNKVKVATSFDEIRTLMEKEQEFLCNEFGVSRRKDAAETEEKSETTEN